LWNPVERAESMAEEVNRLRGDPDLRAVVEGRVREFLDVRRSDTHVWFQELTYCLLTAYSSAERGQLCVDALCDCGALLDGTVEEVAEILRHQGHRFADRRAEYIVEARRYKDSLKDIIASFDDERKLREWLIENIKGIGPKEASHFLRNIGHTDSAILDFHIIDVLARYGLIEKPKTLTRRRYLEIEELLRNIASEAGLNLAELDLYLWYMETGKILK